MSQTMFEGVEQTDAFYPLRAREAFVSASIFVQRNKSPHYFIGAENENFSLDGVKMILEDMKAKKPFQGHSEVGILHPPSEESKYSERLPIWKIISDVCNRVIGKTRSDVSNAETVLANIDDYLNCQFYLQAEQEFLIKLERFDIRTIVVFGSQHKEGDVPVLGQKTLAKQFESAVSFPLLIELIAKAIDIHFAEKCEKVTL